MRRLLLDKKGFTVVELLIVMAIMSSVLLFSLAGANSLKDSQVLSQDSNQLTTILRYLQNQAQSGEFTDPTKQYFGYGISFSTNSGKGTQYSLYEIANTGNAGCPDQINLEDISSIVASQCFEIDSYEVPAISGQVIGKGGGSTVTLPLTLYYNLSPNTASLYVLITAISGDVFFYDNNFGTLLSNGTSMHYSVNMHTTDGFISTVNNISISDVYSGNDFIQS